MDFFVTATVDEFKANLRRWAKAHFPKPHLKNLADKAGINYRQLSGYGDKNLPSGPTMQKLRAAGVDIDSLLPTGMHVVAPLFLKIGPDMMVRETEDIEDIVDQIEESVEHLDALLKHLKRQIKEKKDNG